MNDARQQHQIDRRIILRQLDVNLLPIFSILYLLSFLNGGNIANAKLANLENDVYLTPEQYRWCLSIYFLGFLIFQIPSNIILRCWRPSRWIFLIVFLWGVVAVGMAAVNSFETLLLARFLLGVFQCGFFPAFTYYISLWYCKKEQAFRLGFFWSFSALAGAFGGLIAYAIALIKSSLFSQWQLIFIIEGIPTIILAFVCWSCLPDSPEQAWFLTDKQRQVEIDRLAEDAVVCNEESFSWAQVLSVFTDWKTYIYAAIYICGTIAFQGITLFLPTLIDGMGQWTPIQSQLMTVPPYFAAFIMILIVSHSSDYFVERSFHLVLVNVVTITGFLILIFVDRQNIAILYIGGILTTVGLYSNVSVKVAWINNNFASLTRRAVALAFAISIGAIGGLISGQIYDETQKPRYVRGNTIGLLCTILQTILVIALRFMFIFINQQRSNMNKEEIQKQIKQYDSNPAVGDRHPHFRYTL